MLLRLWRSLVRWVKKLLGIEQPRSAAPQLPSQAAAQPLTDTDYEFLFMQLMEGVSHGWQQDRAIHFFQSLGERGRPEPWLDWLRRFGDRLLASSSPNNELALRMVQLGDLQIGPIGEAAGQIGMQLLTQNAPQPTWDDYQPIVEADFSDMAPQENPSLELPQGEENMEMRTITLEELAGLLQQDPNLLQQLAQQLQIDNADPQTVVNAIVNQANANQAPPPPELSEAENLALQGNQRFQAGDYQGALGFYEQAIQIQPDFHQAWNNRGEVFRVNGQYEDAIASYDKALQLNLKFFESWNNRGHALYALGRYEEAIYSFDNALEINRDLWPAWLGRGNCTVESGDSQPSLSAYSAIALANPNLNQRGYAGQVATYQEAFKYVLPDTQPEGWARLQQALGNAHFDQAEQEANPRPYLEQAIVSYQAALQVFTAETHPQDYADLQNLINQVQGELSQSAPEG